MSLLVHNRWLRVSLVIIGFAVATFLLTASPRRDVFAAENELAAVFRNGALEVSIPYDEAMARSRVLSFEVLDPNDKPIARLTRPVSPSAGTGSWKTAIPLDPKVALEDLAWNRLKISRISAGLRARGNVMRFAEGRACAGLFCWSMTAL